MVKHRSNKGFPPDGMTFAELIHHIYPLFHINDTQIVSSNNGHFLAEKLSSVWKDLIREYDTVMVNFLKSSKYGSSMTKSTLVTE
jgi:hypothetical protein